MAQTTYTMTQGAGFPGMQYDITPAYRRSYVNAEASASIPFGVMMSQGASESGGVLPTTATDKFIGIALHANVYDATQVDAVGVKPGNMISVLSKGTVWVKVEEAVVVGDRPFVRFAAGAGGTQRGAWRKSADTATAVEVKGARYLASAAAGGMAPMEIDVNAVRALQ